MVRISGITAFLLVWAVSLYPAGNIAEAGQEKSVQLVRHAVFAKPGSDIQEVSTATFSK